MIDIIIVNWNSRDQLRTCIESINQFGTPLVGKVIVVDNGSTDGSAENLTNVTIIRSDENLGFAKACNVGASYATSEFFLFLNPDTEIYFDSLSKPLAYMQSPKNENVGICGIQLIDESCKVSRHSSDFPTPLAFINRAVGLSHFFPKLNYIMSKWDHLDTREVDHVIGAFYLVRNSVFKKLNGFDERFFVYLEDLDFSYRAKLQGDLCVYFAESKAFHMGGGTSKQVMARRLFYSLRSRLLYSFKHFNVVSAIFVVLATLFIEPVSRTLFSVSKKSWAGVREVWSAYYMLWRWLPSWIIKGGVHSE